MALCYCNCLFSTMAYQQSSRKFSLSSAFLKKKLHWHKLATKKFPTDKALEHFDDFYKSFFRLKWPSTRLGLLSPQKYVALVNNFGDPEGSETLLSGLGALNLKTMFDIYKRNASKEKDSNMKSDVMEKAFTLDRLIDERINQVEDKELKILYPDGSGEKLKGLLLSEVNVTPENAEDEETLVTDTENRIIHPDLASEASSLYEFVPATKLKGMDDYMQEAEYYSYYKSSADIPIETEKVYDLNFPEQLKVYTFDRGTILNYPQPKRTTLGTFNYYLMDGASLMPVLALDLKKGDRVLDMCAAPGGKSLIMLQTLLPDLLVCNDLSRSRVERIHSVMNQFLYDYGSNWKDMLMVQQYDGSLLEENNVYNKILVDVPCTNDRKSVRDDDDNIFHQIRLRERLRIPETQSRLLANALRLVCPGGTVVYSTCSLSPIQNEGVVAMALRKLWEEFQLEFTIHDLTPALECTTHFMNYARNTGMKYGHLVVPFLPSNFGPMYFCKIVKKMN